MSNKKNKVDSSLLKNLKGFCSEGAQFNSPGNVPTGHFILDFVIHYGMDPTQRNLEVLEKYDPSRVLGLPLGKLVEVFGEEGSGKSSLAYRVCGYAQKMGLPVAWIDTEHSFSSSLAHINDCDCNNILYSNLVNTDNPDKTFWAEDVLDNIITLCDGGVKVVVLDSVANLIPKARGEAKSEQQLMAVLPRLLSDNLGKVVAHAEKSGTLLLFINQLREKVGVMWGNPETSPGGRALKHNASLRIKVAKKNSKDAEIVIKDEETGEDRLIGKKSNVRIEKNRLAKPFYSTLQIPMYFEPYFPDIEEIVFDTGRQVKLISVMKGVFKWKEHRVEGRKDFIQYILDNNLLDELITEVKEKAEEEACILPPELMQYQAKEKANDENNSEILEDTETKDSSSSKKKSTRKRRTTSS